MQDARETKGTACYCAHCLFDATKEYDHGARSAAKEMTGTYY